MGEIYTQTLKYFYIAIIRFLPLLKTLEVSVLEKNDKAEVSDLIEMYSDIEVQIDKLGLSFREPNKRHLGEPVEVKNWLDEGVIENLSRLSIRLLISWKEELKNLQEKKYLTDGNKERISYLEDRIWPLEALSKDPNYVIGKYADKGPLEFPGENKVKKSSPEVIVEDGKGIIFSKDLTSKISADLGGLCNEFNFNYQNKKPNAGLLLLRRILPLAIVRKFQALNRELEIKKPDGDFLDTKGLLGQVEKLLSNKRIYKEIEGYKLLIDSSQHSYSLNVDDSDVEGAAIKIRVLLDDLFYNHK
ncbi:MAG: hypothetical protein A2563_03765 [Candidatus Magasanikbacteria bacterium RIFOXYD1_FULL_40_23]|uniref:Uncharacterized protein n=1 Tax=Candidatus Magasanikbacteria bacterium RIFOXYD1_FULL_40_23 TaxID=1798705 RepID=A0A1F6P9G8_9BACT|nr:MAG: hypothetical protein A2563_03765 [Candidatus Magasanikbacteria bacterium RIFOXYD1_FULL_40_23]